MTLRFDDNPSNRPRNYLLRKEQWRLLVMVASLGLVFFAMQQVRRPGFVAKLEQLFGGGGQPPASEPTPRKAGEGDLLRRPLTPLERGRFTTVRDNSQFRDAETEAWFFTLGALKGAPLAPKGPANPAPVVTYAQLVAQPDAYRGQPVQVRGLVRRVDRVEPASNELGIEELYRIILQPAGGEVWPITIYTLKPPTGAAIGEDVRLAADATGYFFKKQSYRWEGGLGTTPVVLAKTIDIAEPAATPEPNPTQEVQPWTVVLCAGLMSALLIGFFVFRTTAERSNPHSSRELPASITIHEPEA